MTTHRSPAQRRADLKYEAKRPGALVPVRLNDSDLAALDAAREHGETRQDAIRRAIKLLKNIS